MTQLFGYNTQEDSKMLFSDVFQEQSSGLTTEFTPKALRVGSYSGSDTDRQFQSFPTPPDSPVLAELTAPCKNQQTKLQRQQHQQQQLNSAAVEAFSHVQNAGFFGVSGSCLTGGCGDEMDMGDLSLLEDLLLVTDPLQMGEHDYSYNTIHTVSDSLRKSDFGDGFGHLTPDSTLSSSFFPSSFTDALDDCNIPSPTPSSPSPITIADIFSGDLPNLDNLTLGMELAPMDQQQQCQQQQQQQQQRPKQHMGLFGMGSSGEDSDNGSEHSFYSLPLDELQPSTFHPMNVHQMPSSVLTHPPPLYHEHHHNIQSYNQYNNNNQHQQHNHHHQQQQSQSRSPYAQQNGHHLMFNTAVQGMSERTHNYQCRTMHTTLKMLDGQGEGLIKQEITPPDQRSCAGPIRKPCRARPRKQSVTSSEDGCSDEEHVVSTTSGTGRTTPNRNRGRGRREAMKGNHLWEFIRDLLKSDSYCPKFIRWEDRESGVFRFVNSEAVATMWGRKKNNPQMTYEKLSRAMRYYYKREILERVDGRRLVYKFGKNAEGWREAAGLQ